MHWRDVILVFTKDLFVAAATGNVRVVQSLLRGGFLRSPVDPNITRDNNGVQITPLGLAARNGHVEVVIELVKAGADLLMHSERKSPLLLALESRRYDVARVLIAAGAIDAREMNRLMRSAVASGQVAITEPLLTYAHGPIFNVALMEALKLGELELIRLFLDRGVKVTDLDGAFANAVVMGQLEIVRLLLDHGANPNGEHPHPIQTPLNIIRAYIREYREPGSWKFFESEFCQAGLGWWIDAPHKGAFRGLSKAKKLELATRIESLLKRRGGREAAPEDIAAYRADKADRATWSG